MYSWTMARANDTVHTDIIKRGIELYTGRTVGVIQRHADPNVPGAMALRVTFVGSDEHVDFLISANVPHMKTPEDVDAVLEECNFEAWPPRSGKLKFF